MTLLAGTALAQPGLRPPPVIDRNIPVPDGGIPIPGLGGGRGSSSGGGDQQNQPPPPPPPPRPAHEWFLQRPLVIKLPALGGAPVRATLATFRQAPVAGQTCRFDAQQRVATATPQGGFVELVFFGNLHPSRGNPLATGDCRPVLRVQRVNPDGSLSPLQEVDGPAFTVTPHQAVKVTATARMRDWLKPDQGAPCATDDAGGQLGVRATAGPLGADCRVDFLTARNRSSITDRNFNAMPEGVIVTAVTWRLEGDTGQCSLCEDPAAGPCRGLRLPPATYQQTLLGPVVRAQREEQRGADFRSYAIFTGPPFTRRNEPVIEPISGVTIATNAQGVWRSYGLAPVARLACAPWAPAPADVGRAVEGAFGVLRGREPPPPPPPPPSLRLVLDSYEFLRPTSQRLPWE
mgnify:CR=1 FL=1